MDSYIPRHSVLEDDTDAELGRAWFAYEKERQKVQDEKGRADREAERANKAEAEVERLKAQLSGPRPQTTAGGGREEGGVSDSARGWIETALELQGQLERLEAINAENWANSIRHEERAETYRQEREAERDAKEAKGRRLTEAHEALRDSEAALADMAGAFSWGTSGAVSAGVGRCKAALAHVRKVLGARP